VEWTQPTTRGEGNVRITSTSVDPSEDIEISDIRIVFFAEQPEAPNLVFNGDFRYRQFGWTGNLGFGAVHDNNDDANPGNDSEKMARLAGTWNFNATSDPITITEPGLYRLSAWGRAGGYPECLKRIFLVGNANSLVDFTNEEE
jgi:hypothetical protein